MASSRFSLPLPLCLVAILVCLLVFLPGETEARTCVFKCMRNVIACKRKAALSADGSNECCEEYYQCFLECKPHASNLPPCDSKTGKRSMMMVKPSDREVEQDNYLSFPDFF